MPVMLLQPLKAFVQSATALVSGKLVVRATLEKSSWLQP
jgi:hypothetical protein